MIPDGISQRFRRDRPKVGNTEGDTGKVMLEFRFFLIRNIREKPGIVDLFTILLVAAEDFDGRIPVVVEPAGCAHLPELFAVEGAAREFLHEFHDRDVVARGRIHERVVEVEYDCPAFPERVEAVE